MREIGGSILRYTPGAVPSGSVNDYLRDELAKIASVLSQVMDGQVDVTTVEPAKPRDGMIRLADGTEWNPGSGRGFYGYSNSAWRFLG